MSLTCRASKLRPYSGNSCRLKKKEPARNAQKGPSPKAFLVARRHKQLSSKETKLPQLLLKQENFAPCAQQTEYPDALKSQTAHLIIRSGPIMTIVINDSSSAFDRDERHGQTTPSPCLPAHRCSRSAGMPPYGSPVRCRLRSKRNNDDDEPRRGPSCRPIGHKDCTTGSPGRSGTGSSETTTDV